MFYLTINAKVAQKSEQNKAILLIIVISIKIFCVILLLFCAFSPNSSNFFENNSEKTPANMLTLLWRKHDFLYHHKAPLKAWGFKSDTEINEITVFLGNNIGVVSSVRQIAG